MYWPSHEGDMAIEVEVEGEGGLEARCVSRSRSC